MLDHVKSAVRDQRQADSSTLHIACRAQLSSLHWCRASRRSSAHCTGAGLQGAAQLTALVQGFKEARELHVRSPLGLASSVIKHLDAALGQQQQLWAGREASALSRPASRRRGSANYAHRWAWSVMKYLDAPLGQQQQLWAGREVSAQASRCQGCSSAHGATGIVGARSHLGSRAVQRAFCTAAVPSSSQGACSRRAEQKPEQSCRQVGSLLCSASSACLNQRPAVSSGILALQRIPTLQTWR